MPSTCDSKNKINLLTKEKYEAYYFILFYFPLGYIYIAESLGLSSTTFTQCSPEATEFGEITQNHNKGRYTVQGHSKSPTLVLIENSYTTSYL